MRTTFNIGFVCRKSKVTKTGRAPVELSIIINGKRTYLVLPRKEYPDEFGKALPGKRRRIKTFFIFVMSLWTLHIDESVATP